MSFVWLLLPNIMIKKEKQSILLVDADPVNQESIRVILHGFDVDIITIDSADDVTDLVHQYDFALILFAISSRLSS